jgi:hypothetical protein
MSNGFAEPADVCFGLPTAIQPSVTVQYAINNLRLVQQWPIRIYYPIILNNLFFVPSFTAGNVQIFEWPSLKFISNLTFPLPIYSFDMNLLGSFLLTSSATYAMYFLVHFKTGLLPVTLFIQLSYQIII